MRTLKIVDDGIILETPTLPDYINAEKYHFDQSPSTNALKKVIDEILKQEDKAAAVEEAKAYLLEKHAAILVLYKGKESEGLQKPYFNLISGVAKHIFSVITDKANARYSALEFFIQFSGPFDVVNKANRPNLLTFVQDARIVSTTQLIVDLTRTVQSENMGIYIAPGYCYDYAKATELIAKKIPSEDQGDILELLVAMTLTPSVKTAVQISYKKHFAQKPASSDDLEVADDPKYNYPIRKGPTEEKPLETSDLKILADSVKNYPGRIIQHLRKPAQNDGLQIARDPAGNYLTL